MLPIDARCFLLVTFKPDRGPFAKGSGMSQEPVLYTFTDGVARIRLNRPVAGGGIGLALTADLIVAAESACFRSGYSGIGLSPDCGASFFLVRALGATRAKELMFTNRSLPAAEALACGLVNRVVPDAELEPATDALVAELAALPRGSLAAIKTLVGEIADGLYERTLARERELMVENAAGSDVREGIAAFAQRRAPVFA